MYIVQAIGKLENLGSEHMYRFIKVIAHIVQAIGKLENLGSEQMYAEQKWMTSYLKNIRNEADRQSSSLQVISSG